MKNYQYENVVKMTIAAIAMFAAVIYCNSRIAVSSQNAKPIEVVSKVQLDIPNVVVQVKPAYEATLSEFVCLAMTINGEARNQPLSGQIKVGEVVLNRVFHGHWGDDICQVVHYKKDDTYHFTTWDPRDPNYQHIQEAFKNIDTNDVTMESLWVAQQVLNHGVRYLPHDSYNYATFRVDNAWTRKLEFVERDGDHVFRRGF